MVSFYGDYNLTETVNIPFNTFSSDDPSASVTVTNLVAGDVFVHKDGVEGTPTGITVSLNVGTVNGNHLAILDLSDTNDADFYAVGARYQVRMEGVTIDGATVNAWIGAFSIGCTLRPTTVGRTLDVAATGEAGLDFNNIKDAAGARTLTNITIPTVTTLTTKTGFSLADGSVHNATFANDVGSTEWAENPIALAVTKALDAGDVATGAGLDAVVAHGNEEWATAAVWTADEIWTHGTRTLTAFAFTPSLHSDYDAAKTAAQAGDAMALTSGERTTLAAAIEAAIINELDGTAVMQAIADLIADDMTTTDLTVAAIAAATRNAILDRVLAGNHDDAGSVGKVLQDVAGYVDCLPAAWVVPPSVAQLNARTLPTADYFDASEDTVTTDADSRTASKAAGFATSVELADGTVEVGTMQDGALGADAIADIFSTTAIVEAYAAKGAAATLAQLLYEILQNLKEMSISGTTKTVKKLDGSTTAATYTLDDADEPTSITRTT